MKLPSGWSWAYRACISWASAAVMPQAVHRMLVGSCPMAWSMSCRSPVQFTQRSA